MAKQTIDIGIQGNDGTGDSIRESFRMVNENFNELYAIFGLEGTISITRLDDGPVTFTTNQLITVNNNKDAAGNILIDPVTGNPVKERLLARTLVPGDGIGIEFDPIGASDSIKISSTVAGLISDSNPTLSKPLNANRYVIGRLAEPSQATVTLFNQIHPGTITSIDELAIPKGYADANYLRIGPDGTIENALRVRNEPLIPETSDKDYDGNLTGNYLSTEAIQRKDAVYRGGDTMTGPLNLNDHPAPLNGLGTPNGSNDLQAATKFYVDNSSFSSNVNLYVSSATGDDLQQKTPLGKEGRYWQYAYRSIGAAALAAENIMDVASQEPGPYRQRLSYTENNGADQVFATTQTPLANGMPYKGATLTGGNIYIEGYTDAFDLLQANRTFIQSETIAYINSKYVNVFEYDRETCKRDIRLILDAVGYDLVLGSTFNVTRAAASYFTVTNKVSGGSQLSQTIAALEYVRDLVLDYQYNVNGLNSYIVSLIDAICYDLIFQSNYQSIQLALNFDNSNTGLTKEQIIDVIINFSDQLFGVVNKSTIRPARVVSSMLIGFTTWRPNTLYAENKIVIHDGSYYRVTTTHSSSTSFDSSKFTVISESEVPGNKNSTSIVVANISGLISGMSVTGNGIESTAKIAPNGINTVIYDDNDIQYIITLTVPTTTATSGPVTFGENAITVSSTIGIVIDALNPMLVSGNGIADGSKVISIFVDEENNKNYVLLDLPTSSNVSGIGEFYRKTDSAVLLDESTPFAAINSVRTNIEIIVNILRVNALATVLMPNLIDTSVGKASSRDLLFNNIQFIQAECFGYLGSNYPSLPYDKTLWRSYIERIIYSVSYDFMYGLSNANAQSKSAGYSFWNFDDTTVFNSVTEKTAFTEIVSYINTLALKIIDNKVPEIVYQQTVKQYQNSTYSGGLAATGSWISNNIGIINNLIQDYSYATPTVSFNILSSDENLRNVRTDILTEESSNQTYTTGARSYIANNLPVINDQDTLNQIEIKFNTAIDLLRLGVENRKVSEYTSPSSIPAYVTLDRLTILAASDQIVSDTLSYIQTTYPTFGYAEKFWEQDIIHLIEAICYDLTYPFDASSYETTNSLSNNGSYYFGQQFFVTGINGYTNAVLVAENVYNYVQGKLTDLTINSQIEIKISQLISVVNSLIKSISVNEKPPSLNLGYDGDYISARSTFASEGRKNEIAIDTIEYLDANFTGGFNYNQALCYRDIGLMIDAVSIDLVTDGTWQAVGVGKSYYRNASARAIAIGTQYNETIDAIEFVRDLMLQVVRQTTASRYQLFEEQVFDENKSVPEPTLSNPSTPISDITNGNNTGLMDIIINIINNGLGAAPSPTFGSGVWNILIDNGGKGSVDQGVRNNVDIIPAKVIVGVGSPSLEASGAYGSIIKYVPGRDGHVGNANTDLLQIRLTKPGFFSVNEEVEFGETIRDLNITIFVESGIYYEDYPIKLPANVSIKGDEFRRTIIRPRDRISQSPWRKVFFYRDAVIDGLELGLYDYTIDFSKTVTSSIDLEATTNEISITLANGQVPKQWVGLMLMSDQTAVSVSNIVGGTTNKIVTSGNHGLVTGDKVVFVGVEEGNIKIDRIYYVLNRISATEFTLTEKLKSNVIVQLSNITPASLKVINADKRGKAVIDSVSGNIMFCSVIYPFQNKGEITNGNWHLHQTINYGRHYLSDPLDVNSEAKSNKDLDAFLCNDAVRIGNVTFQGHGGFAMVLDPEGQIKTKSPYGQVNSSFSQSNNRKRFAGGQFVDGFVGRLNGSIISVDYDSIVDLNFNQSGGLNAPFKPGTGYTPTSGTQTHEDINLVSIINVTATNATDNTITVSANHYLYQGTKIKFGSSFAGLQANTDYFVLSVSTNTITVSSTLDGNTFDITNTLSNQSIQAKVHKGAVGNVTVTNGAVTNILLTNNGSRYVANTLDGFETLTAETGIGGGSGFSIKVLSVSGRGNTIAVQGSFNSGLDVRPPQPPCAFYVEGIRYQINDVADYDINSATAVLTLDVGTPFNVAGSYNNATCFRDTGLIVDAVTYDMVIGSNYQSIKTGLSYLRATNSAKKVIATQLTQTISGINKAREIAKLLTNDEQANDIIDEKFDIIVTIINQGEGAAPVVNYPQNSLSTANAVKVRDILQANKEFCKKEVVAFLSDSAARGFDVNKLRGYNSAKCQRDVGYIIDAICYDIMYGGDSMIYDVASSYLIPDGNGGYVNAIAGEEIAATAGYGHLKDIIQSLINNLTATVTAGNVTPIVTNGLSGIGTGASEYGKAGTLMNIIINVTSDETPELPLTRTTPVVSSLTLAPIQSTIIASRSSIQYQVISFLNKGGDLNINIEMGGNKSMLANDFAMINDLGYAIVCTNGALSEQVSTFTYYCHTHYWSNNGGQIRSVAGSNAHGDYGLRASGYDSTEKPDSVVLNDDMVQIASIYKKGTYSTEMTPTTSRQSLYVFITDYEYVPYSTSELEIDHTIVGEGIVRYEVASVQYTDIKGVIRLNLSTAGTGGTSTVGLQAPLYHGQKVIIRSLQNFKFTGIDNVRPTRPSTALQFNDKLSEIYRILAYNLTEPTGELLPSNSAVLNSDSSFNFYKFTTDVEYLTLPDPDFVVDVTSIAGNGTDATVTCASNVAYSLGETIVIGDNSSEFDGFHIITTVVNSTQIKFKSTNNVTKTGGTITNRTRGALVGDTKISIIEIGSQAIIDQINKGTYITGWNGRIHNVLKYEPTITGGDKLGYLIIDPIPLDNLVGTATSELSGLSVKNIFFPVSGTKYVTYNVSYDYITLPFVDNTYNIASLNNNNLSYAGWKQVVGLESYTKLKLSAPNNKLRVGMVITTSNSDSKISDGAVIQSIDNSTTITVSAACWIPPASQIIATKYSSVKSIIIVNGGSGFFSTNPPTFEFIGGGPNNSDPTTFAYATAKINSTGNITEINVVRGGAGYVSTPQLKVFNPDGTENTSATLTVVMTDFVEETLTVTTIENINTVTVAYFDTPETFNSETAVRATAITYNSSPKTATFNLSANISVVSGDWCQVYGHNNPLYNGIFEVASVGSNIVTLKLNNNPGAAESIPNDTINSIIGSSVIGSNAPYLVTFTFSTTTAPTVGSLWTVSNNSNVNYNGTFIVNASSTTSITLEYPYDPRDRGNDVEVFDPTNTVLNNSTYVVKSVFNASSNAFGISKPFSLIDATTLRIGYPKNSEALITVRISTCRATGHDFLDIGTGSYSTTNYPFTIYGSPVQSRQQAQEIKENGVGRVFYVSTDQNGIFRVGRYFTVDQGTGTVTFAASIALSNLDGLGFKRGVVVNEFSTDPNMTNNATEIVPVQSAIRGYIDKRLGLDHGGGQVSSDNLIGPGFLPLNGQLPMKANLIMENYQIVNLGAPTSDDNATNKFYVDDLIATEIAKHDELSEMLDVDFTNVATGNLIVRGPSDWINIPLSTSTLSTAHVTIEYNSSSNTFVTTIPSGTIVNSQVSNSAAIAQSKLAMTASSTRANATGIAQANLGLASFDDAQFTATSGWISIKNSGIVFTKLENISPNYVLGNKDNSEKAPFPVSFEDVVTIGGSVLDSSFTSTGVMTVTRTNNVNTYSVTPVTTSGGANSILKTQSNGNLDIVGDTTITNNLTVNGSIFGKITGSITSTSNTLDLPAIINVATGGPQTIVLNMKNRNVYLINLPTVAVALSINFTGGTPDNSTATRTTIIFKRPVSSTGTATVTFPDATIASGAYLSPIDTIARATFLLAEVGGATEVFTFHTLVNAVGAISYVCEGSSPTVVRKIIDFADEVKKIPINTFTGNPTGNLNLNNNKIVSLGTPTENSDAATKLYVDNRIVAGNGVVAVANSPTTNRVTLHVGSSTAYTTGTIPYASSTTTLSFTAQGAAGQVLSYNVSTNTPQWSSALSAIGTVPISNGGTGSTSFTQNSVIYAGSTALLGLGAPSVPSVLYNAGNTSPTWVVATGTGAGANAVLSIGPAITGTATFVNISGTGNLTFGLTDNNANGNGSFTGNLTVGSVKFGSGNINATGNITAYAPSDKRLKENIQNIEDPLEKLLKINGVNFTWTDDYIKSQGGEDGYFVRKQDVGVIAQEIEEVLPEVVANRNDGFKAVKYEKIVPLLIESIKEQQKIIDKQGEQIKQLQDLVNTLVNK